MRRSNEKEIVESGKAFALAVVLMNVLILTVAVEMVWFVQMFISNSYQLTNMVHGFNLM